MADPGADPGGGRGQTPVGRSLRHVRAAQLRARAMRWGMGKSALGMVFLVGALSYALGPEPHAEVSRLWMALLVVLSTAYVGLGLRTFTRARRRGPRGAARVWVPVTVAWGVLSATVVRILLAR